MGLLDDILKSSLGGQTAQSGRQASSLVQGVLDLLDDPEVGGLSGLAQGFQKQGLGDVVSSWIGTGANRSVSAEQVTQALGSDRVSQVAQRAGLSSAAAPGILAAVLPALIDKLTPDGQVPPRAQLADRGKGLVESVSAAVGGSGGQRPKADFSDVKSGTSSTAPAAKAEAAEEVYVVQAGDNLSKIAKRFYGKEDWRRLYEANREVIGANPDLIRPGQKLRIPKG
jgi:uncharacterized protein YidB (DUF937 family)